MRAYKRRGRHPATAPSTLLKILLYANMENIYSSKSIESACKRDINFIWLLNGAPAPNYHEIARFRSKRLSECAEELFFQIAEDIQFGVEGEYITGVSVSSERSDQLTLIPFMENLRNNGIEYKDVTADAGYESEENYTYFENLKTECYIKPQNDERSKTKKFKSNMALRENMAYDAEHDEYTCQAGQKIRAKYVGMQKTKSGYEREVTYYECEDCTGCPYKKKWTKAKGNRRLQVSKKFIEQRVASLERITSPEGIQLRMNRSIQSEGAFGVVKQNYGFRQFLLRGNRKVSTEILLVAMAYNVNKLHSKIQQKRTRTQLFEKDSA